MIIYVFLFLNAISISYTRNIYIQKSGNCFMTRRHGHCRDFIGTTSREDCCSYNGYFIRKRDEGDLFLEKIFFGHTRSECEDPCDADPCVGKVCPTGETCLRGKRGSFCTSDCVCTSEQRASGPVCVVNGPKFLNQCEFHLSSCWGNKTWPTEACAKSGCDLKDCGSKKCVLNLHGQSECVDYIVSCSRDPSRPICGINNITYINECELRRASISRGVQVEVAYIGECRASATCNDVTCPTNKAHCVPHHRTRIPVCVKCPFHMLQCQQPTFKGKEFFCTTNNRQTDNWCYKDYLSCFERSFSEIAHSGMCLRRARLE